MSLLSRHLLTRVYIGADHPTNHQNVAFTAAWSNSPLFSISYVEKLSHKQVKDLKWSQKYIFKWLMACDIHIILCHMHQGMKKGGVWDCSEYLYNYWHLRYIP